MTHPVETLTIDPAGIEREIVGLPLQLNVMDDERLLPLSTSMLINFFGLTKVKLAVLIELFLKETLRVVNCFQGLETYHCPVPQLIKPVGY